MRIKIPKVNPLVGFQQIDWQEKASLASITGFLTLSFMIVILLVVREFRESHYAPYLVGVAVFYLTVYLVCEHQEFKSKTLSIPSFVSMKLRDPKRRTNETGMYDDDGNWIYY